MQNICRKKNKYFEKKVVAITNALEIWIKKSVTFKKLFCQIVCKKGLGTLKTPPTRLGQLSRALRLDQVDQIRSGQVSLS